MGAYRHNISNFTFYIEVSTVSLVPFKYVLLRVGTDFLNLKSIFKKQFNHKIFFINEARVRSEGYSVVCHYYRAEKSQEHSLSVNEGARPLREAANELGKKV